MTRFIPTAFSFALIIGLAGCEDMEKQRQNRAHRFGYHTPADATTDTLQTSEGQKPSPDSDTTQPVTTTTETTQTVHADPKPVPTSPPAPQTRKDYPYAKPVEGKAGFVVSPYAPYSGYVDVRGYPAGTEVACPYTSTDKAKKIFLVP